MTSRSFLVATICILACAANLNSQQAFYGSIVGNVTDSSGAALPEAEITVKNTGTGIEIPLKASGQGIYQALNLTPGRYRVSATAAGFKTLIRDGVIVGGAQQVRVDLSLFVGEVTQTVEVRAESPLINTETATTRLGAITHRQTVSLPSKGSATGDGAVFPDVYTQLSFAYADINNSAFSIGGTLSNQNAVVQDGMRVEGQSHLVGGSRGLSRPTVEAVEELTVTTTNPSAKYPNPAAVEIVMKSGTNDWHGTLWHQHGNRAFNAPSYFTHTKSKFLLNQYGASLGGPISRTKTFFFASFQGFQFPRAEETFSNLPTARMKQGDLSEFLNPDYLRQAGFSNPIVVVDPRTRQPFPNNVIPAERLDPVARRILEVYPEANRDEGRGYMRNYLLTNIGVRKETNFDARVDHYFSPTQHLYGRFTFFHSPNGSRERNIPGFGGNHFFIEGRILTLHHTSTIRPNLLNHVMFGFHRDHNPVGPGFFEKENKAIAWSQRLGIAGIVPEQDSGFPLLTFQQTSVTTPLSWSFGDILEHIWQLRDDVTWNVGRHSIQMGFDFRRDAQGSPVPGGARQNNANSCQYGCIRFNGRWTGLDFADFLLGLPFTSTKFTLAPPDFRNRHEWALYFQDDIKLTSRFNLSVGLRYDYYPVIRSVNDLETLFDPASQRLIVPSEEALSKIPSTGVAVSVPIVTAATAGFPETLLGSDKNNWGPRVGVAYRFVKDSVVRAGVGLYHTPLGSTGRRLLTGPFSPTYDFPDIQPPANGAPVLSLANPYQTAGRTAALINFFAPERKLQDPLHYNYNLALEHQIGNNAFTAEFVGKKSIVPWGPELNAIPASGIPFNRNRLPFPGLGSVAGLQNGAHYDYHALRLNLRRRFAQGLYFDTTYVFSKTIDDLGGISGETGGSSEDPFSRQRDRAESSFMPPHRMTVNYLYELPFGKRGGKLALSDRGVGRVLNYIIGGWETGSTYNFQSSPKLTPSGQYRDAANRNYDAPNTNKLSGRPDCTGQTLEPSPDQLSQGFVFNPDAFTRMVPAGRYGNCGRSNLRFGEGIIAINQSFFRNFQIPWFVGERPAKLRVGVLMYNAINHSNVPSPVVNLDSPLYGKRTTDKTGDIRTMTLQARIDF